MIGCMWCQGLNVNLVFVTFVIVLGSSFQFGYNISVLNQPTKVQLPPANTSLLLSWYTVVPVNYLHVIFYSAVISIHMVTGKLEIDNKDNKITKTGTDRRHRSTNLPAVLIHGALLRFDTHTDTRHDLYSGRFFFTKFSALVELWLRMINLKLVFRSLKGRCHGKQFLLAFSTELSCDDSR